MTVISTTPDTSFDAMAARAMHIEALGLTTGGFSKARLREAGCTGVYENLCEILRALRAEKPLLTR